MYRKEKKECKYNNVGCCLLFSSTKPFNLRGSVCLYRLFCLGLHRIVALALKAKNGLGSSYKWGNWDVKIEVYLETSPSQYSQHLLSCKGKRKRVAVIIGDSNCSVWDTELKLWTERQSFSEWRIHLYLITDAMCLVLVPCMGSSDEGIFECPAFSDLLWSHSRFFMCLLRSFVCLFCLKMELTWGRTG